MASPVLWLARCPGTFPTGMCHSWSAGSLHPQANSWLNWGHPGSCKGEASVLLFTLELFVPSESQQIQPVWSTGQNVDAARQFLARWTTANDFWIQRIHKRPTSYNADLANMSLIPADAFLCHNFCLVMSFILCKNILYI